MKIAVIGSGPAAAGACLGLLDSGKSLDITVFDIGRKLGKSTAPLLKRKPKWERNVYAGLHKEIGKAGGGWIPEKSYFGNFADKYTQLPIYKSDMFGGLSKFWGASFLPFTENDLQQWPVSLNLQPYYKKLLSHIRIAGAEDRLESYFTPHLYNESPLRLPKVFRRMEAALNRNPAASVIAGNPRLAVANSGDAGCTYCGHCFYGCYNDSIYSADQTLEKLIADKSIRYVPGKRLIRYKPASASGVEITLQDIDRSMPETHLFDKLYVAAGCIETTRVVSQSTGEYQFPIIENPMFHVPILYTGAVKHAEFREHIALNNLLIGILPGSGIENYVHMQVYPINIYLWNHFFSKFFSASGPSLAELAQKTIGKQIYMALFYLHGDYTKGSTLRFSGQEENLRFTYAEETLRQAKLALEQLSSAFKGSGFHLLKAWMSPLPAGGSYHYAGTLPLGDSQYAAADLGEIAKNVYICDSASFPSIPSQNHSYSIMANAFRVAEQSVLS